MRYRRDTINRYIERHCETNGGERKKKERKKKRRRGVSSTASTKNRHSKKYRKVEIEPAYRSTPDCTSESTKCRRSPMTRQRDTVTTMLVSLFEGSLRDVTENNSMKIIWIRKSYCCSATKVS